MFSVISFYISRLFSQMRRASRITLFGIGLVWMVEMTIFMNLIILWMLGAFSLFARGLVFSFLAVFNYFSFFRVFFILNVLNILRDFSILIILAKFG